jgi:uncharacterized protein (TIGR02058 family)
MAKKAYLIEFGSGVDLHGGNSTKASQRAVKDATQHCSIVGIMDLLKISDIKDAKSVLDKISVSIKVGTPFPEKVDKNALLTELPPYKNVDIEVVDGGLLLDGKMGQGDTLLIANAALTIYIDY